MNNLNSLIERKEPNYNGEKHPYKIRCKKGEEIYYEDVEGVVVGPYGIRQLDEDGDFIIDHVRTGNRITSFSIKREAYAFVEGCIKSERFSYLLTMLNEDDVSQEMKDHYNYIRKSLNLDAYYV